MHVGIFSDSYAVYLDQCEGFRGCESCLDLFQCRVKWLVIALIVN
jgi:hypothetical protein